MFSIHVSYTRMTYWDRGYSVRYEILDNLSGIEGKNEWMTSVTSVSVSIVMLFIVRSRTK